MPAVSMELDLSPDQRQTLQERIDRGLMEYSAQQFHDAKDTFMALSRDYPYIGKLWMYLGNAEYRLRAYLLAEKSWKEGLLLNPLDVDGYLNLGSLLVEQQCYEEAIYYWRLGLSIEEKHKALWISLANLYSKLKRPVKAAQLYQKYMEIAGARDGETQRIQRRLTQGYSAYKPNIQIATLGLKQNNLDHARRALHKALEYYPGTSKDYKIYAAILYKQGKLDDAKEAYWHAIELNETDPALYVNLGIILEKNKERVNAAWAYTRALRLSENDKDLNAKLRPRLDKLINSLKDDRGFESYFEKAKKSRESYDLEDAKNRLLRLQDLIPHTEHLRTGMEDEMRAMNELFEIKSRARTLFYSQGEKYLSQEHDEAALHYFELYMQYFPEDEIAKELPDICAALEARIAEKKALEEEERQKKQLKRRR